MDLTRSVVPNGMGARPRVLDGDGWGCLVGAPVDVSIAFFAELAKAKADVVVVHTKEITASADVLSSIIGNGEEAKRVAAKVKTSDTPVVGFWLNGADCPAAVRTAAAGVPQAGEYVYTSSSPDVAAVDGERFSQKYQLTMAV